MRKLYLSHYAGINRCRCVSGFALVVALVLMGFILILLLALTSLTAVETQVSSVSLEMVKARKNALFAMNAALAQLQELAGPDQRVTARADVLARSENGVAVDLPDLPTAVIPDMSSSSAAGSYRSAMESWDSRLDSFWMARNSRWTGVWANAASAESVYTESPSPTFLGWLVSGAANPVYDVATAAGEFGRVTVSSQGAAGALASDVISGMGATGDSIKVGNRSAALMLGEGTLGSGAPQSDYVVAPVVDVNGDGDGRYAYWVADEGVKAKVTLSDPYRSESSGGSVPGAYRFLAAQRPAVNRIDGFAALPDDEASLSRLMLFEQLPLFSGITEDVVGRRFHDVTLSAYGIVADSLRGGLRQDLTSLLASGSLSGKMLPAAVSPALGPNWETLQASHDLTLSAASNVAIAPESASASGIMPVLLQVRSYIYPDRSAADEVTLRFAITFVLANPYTVAISADDGLDFIVPDPSTLGYTVPKAKVTFDLTDSGETGSRTVVFDEDYLQMLSKITFRTKPFVLDAGQVMAFSLEQDQVVSGGNQVVTLDSSFDPGTALVCPSSATEVTGVRKGKLTLATSGASDIELRLAGSEETLVLVHNTSFLGAGGAPDRRLVNGTHFQGTGGKLMIKTPEEMTDSTDVRIYADYNLRASALRRPSAHNAAGRGFNGNPLYSAATISNDTQYGSDLADLQWGSSETVASGKARFALYPLPHSVGGRQTFMSLGQLAHVDLSADDAHARSSVQPAFAVGNSWASPYVQRDQTQTLNFGENYYDIGYLLNARLWDAYYFSTVPQSGTLNIARELRLPNGRLRFAAETLPTSAQARDPQKVAAWQLLDGGFNVNSTSVQAWRSLLGALQGLELNGDTGLNAPFPRSLNQLMGSAGAADGVSDESWAGFRDLTNDELDELALNIVRQIRLRGPSVSLAHFINRRLVPYGGGNAATDAINTGLETVASELGLRGTIEAAIEASGLNADILGAYNKVVAKTGSNNEQAGYKDWRATEGARAMAIPGWLTQSDVLVPLSPVLASRSDTFLIRAYGDTYSNGKVGARAWCEALVQRVPDYLADSVDAWEMPSSLSGQEAVSVARFGRQFRVLSFRWMNPEEI